jgi:hypothetical protein
MKIEEIKKEIQEKIDKEFNGEESWQFASGVMHVLNTYYIPLAESHRELVNLLEVFLQEQLNNGIKCEEIQSALCNAKKLISNEINNNE